MDIEHAIENADEAQANHYLARGRCYACLSMFKEAITDLSIAINLNKDLLDVSGLGRNNITFRPILTEASVRTWLETQGLPSWISKRSSLLNL